MGDLDAPCVSDGSEHRLLFVPTDPAHLAAVVSAERHGQRTR